MPGGFGTFDEVFEAATLIQTAKIKHFPIVLVGSEYWRPLIDVMRTTLLGEGTVDAADIDMLRITDSAEEAVAYVRDEAMTKFGLSYMPKVRRRRFLFE
jgi:predicted Rossmann-fold nucleotide-binding protein